MLFRVKHEALLPNFFTADLRECFVIGAGYGELSSERAYSRSESITCIREDGGIIEVPLDAYAVGEDGKAGLRGRLVSKQGAILAKAMAAGFLEAFASMFTKVPVPQIGLTPGSTTQFQSVLSGDSVQSAALQGTGKALDRLAQFYIDMAEQYFPIIEVDAGRRVEFVLNHGVQLRIRAAAQGQAD
jgi:conjugal transfer pilus assembly protein TraB